jgi:hypothetical protein
MVTGGKIGLGLPEDAAIFLFVALSWSDLKPIQSATKWVPGYLSVGIKWPERETDDLYPPDVQVMTAWSISSTPSYVFMAWRFITGGTLCSVQFDMHRMSYIFVYKKSKEPAAPLKRARLFIALSTLFSLPLFKKRFVFSSIRK